MKTGNLLNEKVKELEEKLTRVNLIIYDCKGFMCRVEELEKDLINLFKVE